jgi:hypothetical protein
MADINGNGFFSTRDYLECSDNDENGKQRAAMPKQMMNIDDDGNDTSNEEHYQRSTKNSQIEHCKWTIDRTHRRSMHTHNDGVENTAKQQHRVVLAKAVQERLRVADQAQLVSFTVYKLDCDVADLQLWTDALILPHSWRLSIRAHLHPLQTRLKQQWHSVLALQTTLMPPFILDSTMLKAFQAQLLYLEQCARQMENALLDCKQAALDGQAYLASRVLQNWVRQFLYRVYFHQNIYVCS